LGSDAGNGLIVERLQGGPEVLYEPHPESGVICLAVSVEAGSCCETSITRGISHFLEHMVFNGSERYTREEISSWVDDVGAFLNAFTRKETTVYFLLVDTGQLEQGIEILSQMFLHSIFYPAELEKERNIVLEEIRQTMDNPVSERNRFVDRYLYRGSSLAEPVLGYPSTVESITHSDIIDFYKKHYEPSRMRVVVMGGFDVEKARGWLVDYFCSTGGCAKAVDRPSGYRAGAVPRWGNEITVKGDERLTPGLDILIPMPSVGERDFPAALLIANILGTNGSPLRSMFESVSLPDPEVSLEVHSKFSALRIHVGPCEGGQEPYYKVPSILEALAGWKPTAGEIESARVSFVSSQIFDREKYHFYIMSEGERIGLFGARYISATIE
ncbi:MAG: insulinase family protein, partial [Candidatus Krumholzibacteria bacterium]|nr:insulinase family protein [Candidatus Krumholzibacteria bacterium]